MTEETNWLPDPVVPEGWRVVRSDDGAGYVIVEPDADPPQGGICVHSGEVHDLCRAMLAAADGYPHPVAEGHEPMEVVIAPKGEGGTVGLMAPQLVVGVQMGWFDARCLALKLLDAAALSGSTQFLVDNGWSPPERFGEDQVDERAEAAPPDPDTQTAAEHYPDWDDPGSPFGEEPPDAVIHEAPDVFADEP